MNSVLQNEIENNSNLQSISIYQVINILNNQEANEIKWIIDDPKKLIPKGDLLALLSFDSQVKLYDWMEAKASNESKIFNMFYATHEHFKVNNPLFQSTMQMLFNQFNLITAEELEIIQHLGKRKKTRAEELIGRKFTPFDIQS